MAFLIGVAPAPVNAQDASLGCYVLLCAAAVNPSWSGIPACVPKMEKLFEMLGKGDPWPSCPEGGEVGGLNYQPYLPCPEGTVAGTMVDNSSSGGEEWQPNGNGNLCGQVTTIVGGFRNEGPTVAVSATARPTRSDPYNVEISTPGRAPFTFWFALHGS
ncbi:hypothetical protein GCM10007874_10560 [Labrys miyagiensis]|uniref:Uncharacterized protein n=1 Tax=Labrys miyagiensis TaxID=346912 RepID=A0ABQ6CGR9_9HYPH|nr:hypothetical protein [Labrys miyagiensis]GLS18040.1 hypothetical protein GCM10007874_10560 [Labrys miyagiensis]